MECANQPAEQFFSTLDNETRRQITRLSRRLHYRTGDTIIAEGDVGSEAFVLVNGRCAVLTGEKVVTHIGPNELFGEIGALGDGVRIATVRAVEPSEVLAIGSVILQSTLEQKPVLLSQLLRSVVNRTRWISSRETLARSEHLELQAAQRSLVPTPEVFHDTESLDLEVKWEPLTYASGDYCDVISQGSQRYLVAVGDVMGHGARAALTLATVRGHLRELSGHDYSPAEMLRRMDAHITKHGPKNSHITLVVATVDARQRHIRYSIAGHPQPLLYRAGCAESCEAANGPLLGYGFGESYDYPESEVGLERGDRLFMFTDGLCEARRGHDPIKDMIGVEGLRTVFQDICRNQSEQILPEVFTAVAGFRKGYPTHDDATGLLIHVR